MTSRVTFARGKIRTIVLNGNEATYNAIIQISQFYQPWVTLFFAGGEKVICLV
jgi:hypothetical protein